MDDGLILPPARGMLGGMNKLSGGAVFFICLFLGIIFENVALGIIAGLLFGAGVGKATASRERTDA